MGGCEVLDEDRTLGMVGFGQRQHRLEHLELSFGFVRAVEREAVGERHQQRARRAHPLGRFPQQLEHDRRDALPLALGRDQTHGLVAERSYRHEERNIHSSFSQDPGCFRSGIPNQSTRRSNGAHKREMVRGGRAYPAPGHQLVEPIERYAEIRVGLDARGIKGLAAMAALERPDRHRVG